MTQNDKSEPSALSLCAAIQLRSDELIAALTKTLERHPELLAAAVANLQPQHPPIPEPIHPRRWSSDPNAFASLLRARRTEAMLTREQLSIQSGVAASTIRNIESHRHQPTKKTQLLIVRAFDGPHEDELGSSPASCDKNS